MMRITSRILLSLLLSFLVQTLFAQNVQKEANIWYMGNYIGIDFNSGTAVPINDGQVNTIEGVATISDANGALLFYTDGIKVWNKLHQVMPNGTGLFGNPSSSQSGVIVPKIGDPNRYYVFTVDQLSGPRGLNYSIVNMTLDGGKGDVELKNSPLQLNVVEKITAVKHCNNRDIWVIAHGSVSDIYYAWLVTSAGVNSTPVISHTGVVLPGVVPPSTQDSSSLGYLKASPNGKKIVAAHWTVNIDLSDFDNATGIISNSMSLHQAPDPRYLSYGVEFSPNSNLLYTTVWSGANTAFSKNELHQYDISLGSPAAIRASRQILAGLFDPAERYAALQIAPDGKMYMAQNLPSAISPTYISSISSPNTYGPGCNFTNIAIQWSGPLQRSTFGLPTFIQSYFYPLDSFTHTVTCQSLTANFNYIAAANVTSVKWDFGDPASGGNNTSTLNNPVHIFSAPGNYVVKLIKFTNCGTDTISKNLTTNAIDLDLGPDIIVCGNTSVILNSSGTGSTNTFLWQDGSTNPTYTAAASGLYWVEARNSAGCIKRDSINVSFKPIPVFNLGPDASICAGDALTLNATVAGATSYLWNTGATSSSIQANQAGIYWCEVNNGGCSFRDSLSIISIKPAPVVNLGADQTLCEGITVRLDATFAGATYLWQDGNTNPVYTVNAQGTYHVRLDLDGCRRSDTVKVNYTLKPAINLGPDQIICQGKTIVLKPQVDPSMQLTWQDNSSGPTYSVTQPGTYSLTAVNNCGSSYDEVKFTPGTCTIYIPSAFTPNNDGNNDVFKVLGTDLVSQFTLRIFNRYGQVIFETSDKNRGWDGKVKGSPSSPGGYVYVVKYKDNVWPDPQVIQGSFILLR
ncbi:MAG TPA: T9SS type B sorting domain-containing protein [Ferruginibacter sp.]|nr:T9SS type B sorting domain-containing protein [Ferruginibacter sp.]